ncbi:MAG: hypothetical protein ACP5NQ_09715 [Vulcanisaeta sp.]
MGMKAASRGWLFVAIAAVVLFVSALVVALFRPVSPGLIISEPTYYGHVACNDSYDIVIPGNTTIVLIYHVHGNLTINYVYLGVNFPLRIVNEVLSALPRLPNPQSAMWLGVYLNGRLIAYDNQSEPVMGLITTVNQQYPYLYYNATARKYEVLPNKSMSFWQFMSTGNASILRTGFAVRLLPAVSVKSGDVITIVLYSAVPYALPICSIMSEAGEVQLMVKYGWIGKPGSSPTAQQLIKSNQYITEVPIIYVTNQPIIGSQQININNIKPYITNAAPAYIMAYW